LLRYDPCMSVAVSINETTAVAVEEPNPGLTF